MITFDINANKLMAGINRMRLNLRNAVGDVLDQQGRSAKRYAKSIAPIDSGKLRAGIFYQATKERLVITSKVPGNFPYNKWVNQDPGFVTLGPYKKSNSKYGIEVGDSITYGSSLSWWKWSGEAQYMTKTRLRMYKNAPLAMRRKLKTIFR